MLSERAPFPYNSALWHEDAIMIRVCHGDIFRSRAAALVNPVNCKGAMGRGLARQFKRRYPAMYADYVKKCQRGEIRPGQVSVYQLGKVPGQVSIYRASPVYIVNFPTKDDWREPSKLKYIEQGLPALRQWVEEERVPSIAIPALGCGYRGLSWENVEPLIVRELARKNHHVSG